MESNDDFDGVNFETIKNKCPLCILKKAWICRCDAGRKLVYVLSGLV